MSKLILIIATLVVSSCAISGEKVCLSEKSISIERLTPPIHIQDGVKRKEAITVTMPVSCKNSEVVVPLSYDEAIVLLDKALPLDYKAALSRGVNGGSTIYLESDYGSSVDTDLFNFFHDNWDLDSTNNICTKKLGEKYDANEEGCYWHIQDSLADLYKNKK